MQQVDGIVAISSESLSSLRKIYDGNFLMKKILNGVDGAIFTPAFQRSEMRKVFDVSPESPLLIYAGSLTYEKRIDRLLRAMKQCVSQIPDLHLWILGDGMLR